MLVIHNDHIEASLCLQESLFYIQKWLTKWRIKANGTKSVHVTFIIYKKICPPVILNGLRILENIKYLELHLDRGLNWKKTYSLSENNLNFKYTGKIYWLIGSLQFKYRNITMISKQIS